MSACERCAQQQGKSAKAKPHERLRIESTRIAGDAETYAYSCRDCRTKWMRIVPKPAGRQISLWRTVTHLPEPI